MFTTLFMNSRYIESMKAFNKFDKIFIVVNDIQAIANKDGRSLNPFLLNAKEFSMLEY